MKLIGRGQLDPTLFATHHFALGDTMAAYDTFADAATTDALKVVLSGTEVPAEETSSRVAAMAAG
jgi:alcohol dehydrogenase